MATKKDLIQTATERNIRFKKSWDKDRIAAAIASGITNNDPIWVECKLCGVKFDLGVYGAGETTTVHPELARYRSSAVKHGWYASFQACLEYCKEKGFKTIEEVKLVLAKAEAGEDWEITEIREEEVYYNLRLSDAKNTGGGYPRKAWVALLVGLDSTYGFARKFVETAALEGRDRYFNLEYAGYYESKTWTAKGDSTVSYWKVTELGGIPVRCDYQEIVEAIGDPETEKRKREEFWAELDRQTIKVSFKGNPIANVIVEEGQYYFVLHVGSFVEDIDGFTWESDREKGSGEDIQFEYPGYYCRLATELEIENYQQAINQKAAIAEAKTEFKQIVDRIHKNAIRPEKSLRTPYPKGLEVTYTHGRNLVIETTGRVWHLLSNSGDGDDWYHNNVAGRYVGKYLDFTPAEVNRLLGLIQALELPVI